MAWKVEIDLAAERDLGKLDPQIARRILVFLHDRVAKLDDPRIGVIDVEHFNRNGGVAGGAKLSLIRQSVADLFRCWWRLRIRRERAATVRER